MDGKFSPVKLTLLEFNKKIDHFENHPKYGWLRKYADEAIWWYDLQGILQIKAEDFIERIINMPMDYIQDWLDGKNQLEWKPEYRPANW